MPKTIWFVIINSSVSHKMLSITTSTWFMSTIFLGTCSKESRLNWTYGWGEKNSWCGMIHSVLKGKSENVKGSHCSANSRTVIKKIRFSFPSKTQLIYSQNYVLESRHDLPTSNWVFEVELAENESLISLFLINDIFHESRLLTFCLSVVVGWFISIAELLRP